MNAAFSRGEALIRLENLSTVIVTHLALLAWAPNDQCVGHWQGEIDAFKRAIARYDKSKMRKKHNFDHRMVLELLLDEIDTDERRDDILLLVQSHGVNLDEPNWEALEKSLDDFASAITVK